MCVFLGECVWFAMHTRCIAGEQSCTGTYVHWCAGLVATGCRLMRHEMAQNGASGGTSSQVRYRGRSVAASGPGVARSGRCSVRGARRYRPGVEVSGLLVALLGAALARLTAALPTNSHL